MINDLDSTLEQLLTLELNGVVSNLNISFDTPDDQFQPPPPTVDLFLYDVRENRELRSNDWSLERQNGNTVRRKPPLVRVDCSYLITAWAGANDVRGEHQLLGEIMRVLLRYPILPEAVLHGSLENQEPPLPTSVLQPGHLQSLGEFWQALGGKPKAALNYTVTIGVEVQKPLEAGPPVRDKLLKFRQGTEED